MYEYLRIMKKAYAHATTTLEIDLLRRNYRASLFALYKSKKISLDMWEFLTLRNNNLWFNSYND